MSDLVRPGQGGALVLNAGTPVEQVLGGKVAGRRLAENDTVTIVTPGAGGYGPPAERGRAALARDLQEGKVSPGVAREVYGIASDRGP